MLRAAATLTAAWLAALLLAWAVDPQLLPFQGSAPARLLYSGPGVTLPKPGFGVGLLRPAPVPHVPVLEPVEPALPRTSVVAPLPWQPLAPLAAQPAGAQAGGSFAPQTEFDGAVFEPPRSDEQQQSSFSSGASHDLAAPQRPGGHEWLTQGFRMPVPRHLRPTVRLVIALAVAAAVAGAVRAKTKTKVAAAPVEVELSTWSLRTPLAPLAPLVQPRASAVMKAVEFKANQTGEDSGQTAETEGTVVSVEADDDGGMCNALSVFIEPEELDVINTRLEAAFAAGNFPLSNQGRNVLQVQDDLYLRFKARYQCERPEDSCFNCDGLTGELDDKLTPERIRLLEAIRAGDLATIRASTNMSWDFIYPPAQVNSAGKRVNEAWCRTPLCLIVRPDEGNFEAFLPGVSDEERHNLIREVLSAGCASPNYPGTYWSGPAVHACFEGDAVALDLLRQWGCNLEQRVEWMLQDAAEFTLVHAAAFNGQHKVLEYLSDYLPKSFFQTLDATGSNPLHTALESSQDLFTTKVLLDQGCDGFALNAAGRSPLSMAIERLPALAKVLLETKSRYEYRWWGNDLFWFSYDGLILPLTAEQNGNAKNAKLGWVDRQEEQQAQSGNRIGPLRVSNQNGERTTIEQLIIRHERKDLLETYVMKELIERKWRFFGQKRFTQRFGKFLALAASVFGVTILDESPQLLVYACGLTAVSYTFYLQDFRQHLRAINKQKVPEDAQRALSSQLSLADVSDFYSLVLIPILLVHQVATTVPGLAATDPTVLTALGFLSGTLQLSIAFRALNFLSIFEALGPLLSATVAIFNDASRFAGVIAVVTVGYANAFYSLVHFVADKEQIASLDFDYSWSSILSNMGLWLLGQADFAMIEPLAPLGTGVMAGFEAFFWSYIGITFFVLCNLLIAIFNSTYDRVQDNANAEYLFGRMQTLLQFETDVEDGSVQAYYQHLVSRNEKRIVKDEGYGDPAADQYKQ